MKTILLLLVIIITFSCNSIDNEKRLFIYVGAASKPATEEVIQNYEKEFNVKIEANYGGSGTMLSQMILSGKGDIYFPGSSDFMELAKLKNAVLPETEKIVAYLVSSINVQKGNPKNILSIKDLAKENLKIAIGNPSSVCVGTYAVEIIEANLNDQEKAQFKKNLINYTESCSKTATAISLDLVDVIIGWRVFENWDPQNIQSIPMRDNEILRVGYLPVAISKFSTNKKLAQHFLNYLLSGKGKESFKKYNYFTTKEEAFNYIGIEKPIGGTYLLPEDWK